MCMCIVVQYRVLTLFSWPRVVYPPLSWWYDLGMMYIIFRDILVGYFSCVTIFIFFVLVFMWCVFHSWGIDDHLCALKIHSCVADIHSCDFHVYCCICSTYGDVILYHVQDCYLFSGYHSWYLIYSIIINCLLFVIIWKTFGSWCGKIVGAVLVVWISAGYIFIGFPSSSLLALS